MLKRKFSFFRAVRAPVSHGVALPPHSFSGSCSARGWCTPGRGGSGVVFALCVTGGV